MPNPSVLYIVGWAVAILAAAMLVPLAVALSHGEWNEASSFFISGLVTMFLAGGLIAGARGHSAPVDRQQSVVLLLLVWMVLAICGALPIYFAVPRAGLIGALMESASGLTTTGVSALGSVDALPRTIVFWRSLLQWLGGALVLLSILLILSPFRISGPAGPAFGKLPVLERSDLPRRIKSVTATVLPVYAGLTFACFVALWAFGVPGFEALCLALSTLSTGGFLPSDAGIAQYGSAMVEFVLIVFMGVGATSIVAHRATVARGGARHSLQGESGSFVLLALVAALALTFYHVVAGAGSGVSLLENFRVALFRAVSIVSTTGFDNASAGFSIPVPITALLMLTLVGGCAFSTAGGLKIFRISMLLKQSGHELDRLVHPHGVSIVRMAGRSTPPRVVKPVWILFSVYLGFAIVISLTLALDGLSLQNSLALAIAIVSNSGPAIALGPAGADGDLIAGLSVATKTVLTAGMIVGRLELLIVLSLFSAGSWRS